MRLFAFFCTGDEIPAEMVLKHHPKFIGTAVTEKGGNSGGDYPGSEVLHVFEVDASD